MYQFIQMLIFLITTNMRTTTTTITSILSTFYPQLIFTEDENRIYLFEGRICIAKDNKGNRMNAHEVFCSTILQEYFILHFPFAIPYYNMTHGIIVKPLFIPFNKDENAYTLNAYFHYGSSLVHKGFSINPMLNKVGTLNGKLVLTNYSNFIPYPTPLPLTCNHGNYMFGGLEPCSPCGCNVASSQNIKALEFYHFENLKKYTGGF